MANSISKYSGLRVIIDRSFDTIENLIIHSATKKGLNLFPRITKAIASFVQSIYDFRLNDALNKYPDQKKLILYSSSDEFVPEEFTQGRGNFMQGKVCIDLKIKHDPDLIQHPEVSPHIQRFLD